MTYLGQPYRHLTTGIIGTLVFNTKTLEGEEEVEILAILVEVEGASPYVLQAYRKDFRLTYIANKK